MNVTVRLWAPGTGYDGREVTVGTGEVLIAFPHPPGNPGPTPVFVPSGHHGGDGTPIWHDPDTAPFTTTGGA